jgi:hypothetical protein
MCFTITNERTVAFTDLRGLAHPGLVPTHFPGSPAVTAAGTWLSGALNA